MTDFIVGRKYRCIRGAQDLLTGHYYEVLRISENTLAIRNTNGIHFNWLKTRFDVQDSIPLDTSAIEMSVKDLHEINAVCRSMMEIVFRKGEKTNWADFELVLNQSLTRQQEIMFPVNKYLLPD